MVELPTWQGDKPVFVAIETDTVTILDLDEPGWAQTHAELLRAESVWHLVRKADNAVIYSMRVWDGEAPYIIGRHVGKGLFGAGTTFQVTAYGMGKKRRDGFVDCAWILPDNHVVLGDDVEWFADGLLREMLADAMRMAAAGQTPAASEERHGQDGYAPDGIVDGESRGRQERLGDAGKGQDDHSSSAGPKGPAA